MELFYHDVGLKGADRDFPRTVFGSVPVKVVEEHAPHHLRAEMVDGLGALFPAGSFNCWGVPAGAASVIKQLDVGDVMLLVRTTGGDGDIPALCLVRAFWKEPMPALSSALWGSERFPYVFFFNTERISLTWTDFIRDVGYADNFRPSGNVYRVREDRIEDHGGTPGYVAHLLGKQRLVYPEDVPSGRVAESTPAAEFEEGQRLVSERAYFKRNPELVTRAKKHYGYICQACGFSFRETYGRLGDDYIECHHLNPLSEREDAEALIATSLDEVTVLCSNCHRMIHRSRPALSMEQLRAYLGRGASG